MQRLIQGLQVSPITSWLFAYYRDQATGAIKIVPIWQKVCSNWQKCDWKD